MYIQELDPLYKLLCKSLELEERVVLLNARVTVVRELLGQQILQKKIYLQYMSKILKCQCPSIFTLYKATTYSRAPTLRSTNSQKSVCSGWLCRVNILGH
jgi:hypothetical protein